MEGTFFSYFSLPFTIHDTFILFFTFFTFSFSWSSGKAWSISSLFPVVLHSYYLFNIRFLSFPVWWFIVQYYTAHYKQMG
ncbi:hypothetical protein HOY80DRAFT_991551, partial [Tuber brumale]